MPTLQHPSYLQGWVMLRVGDTRLGRFCRGVNIGPPRFMLRNLDPHSQVAGAGRRQGGDLSLVVKAMRGVSTSIKGLRLAKVAIAIFVLLGIWPDRAALAQTYDFSSAVECSSVPFSGFGFQQCWESNIILKGGNRRKAWKLLYSDQTSDIVLGYYKSVGVGGWSFEDDSQVMRQFPNAAVFRGHLHGISLLTPVVRDGSDRSLTFSRHKSQSALQQQQCRGLWRYGPYGNRGYAYLVVAFFCRAGTSAPSLEEVRFLTREFQFK